MNSKEEIKYLRHLSKTIKKLRLEKNLTQADLNVDERTIRRIENENFNPSFLTLIQISKALEVPLSQLVAIE